MKRLSDGKTSTVWSGGSRRGLRQRESLPARPRDYIDALRQLFCRTAKAGIKEITVVPYCRVSSDKQDRNGNLDHQKPWLRRRILEQARLYGIQVKFLKQEFGETVSAWRLTRSERTALVKAARFAKRHDAVLVALDTTKFVRNKRHADGKEPTVADFEQLQSLVGDVRLATARYPDYGEDRSKNTKRGMWTKDCSSGYTIRRRRRVLPDVMELMDEGRGNREIGRLLDLPESDLRRWRDRHWRN